MKGFRIFLNRFLTNRLAVAGAFVVMLLFIAAVFAPFIAPYDPQRIDAYHVFSPPSPGHLFGTDELGRDVFSRVLWGTRVSLEVGFAAYGIALFVGIIVGAISGYYGGWVDSTLMRFVDIMLNFPTLFLILAVIAIMEPNIIIIMVVIGITGWMDVARLVRAEFLTLKEREFILAAKAIGAGDLRIISRHMLPNAMAPVFVSATMGVAGAILIESSLSFLGLGVQPPMPSWGNMLASGRDNIGVAWWLSVFPGLAILITVLSYNLVGEGLRDALDPRLWEAGRS